MQETHFEISQLNITKAQIHQAILLSHNISMYGGKCLSEFFVVDRRDGLFDFQRLSSYSFTIDLLKDNKFQTFTLTYKALIEYLFNEFTQRGYGLIKMEMKKQIGSKFEIITKLFLVRDPEFVAVLPHGLESIMNSDTEASLKMFEELINGIFTILYSKNKFYFSVNTENSIDEADKSIEAKL